MLLITKHTLNDFRRCFCPFLFYNINMYTGESRFRYEKFLSLFLFVFLFSFLLCSYALMFFVFSWNFAFVFCFCFIYFLNTQIIHKGKKERNVGASRKMKELLFQGHSNSKLLETQTNEIIRKRKS